MIGNGTTMSNLTVNSQYAKVKRNETKFVVVLQSKGFVIAAEIRTIKVIQ